MHPAVLAQQQPNKPAYIMAETGEIITRQTLEDSSNQAAQLFRQLGLQRGDHIAVMMENHVAYIQICLAAMRAGLYFTCISYRLQEQEVAYIVSDCNARVFITTRGQQAVVERLIENAPNIEQCYMLDGVIGGFDSWEEATAAMPTTPIADESL